MFEADDIRDWLGLSVVDREGSKIGVLEGLYYDTSSDTAAFASVKVGFPGGGRLVFVPLAGARVAPKQLRVEVDKKLAKSAPAIAVDGQLDSDAEPELYAYYGLTYERGASGERRLGRR